MEQIRQAVERAKATLAKAEDGFGRSVPQQLEGTGGGRPRLSPRTKSFDMLRTQVLQSMNPKNWQFLAITSPTAGCGKTVTAINLALSIARQPELSALLIDMDLPKPAVAKYLGLD